MSQQRYVSNELTHFVGRGLTESEQFDLLLRILRAGWLTHPPHDIKQRYRMGRKPHANVSDNEMYAPGVVCFCDIPVGDLEIHIGKYGSFGLAFLKTTYALKSANPVFYIAKSTTVRRTLMSGRGEMPRGEYFNAIMKEFHEFMQDVTPMLGGDAKQYAKLQRVARVRNLLEAYVFAFVKFFDEGKSEGDPDNYYMEREWRVLGNVRFKLDEVSRVIIPRSFASRFRQELPEYCGQLTFV